MTRPPDQDPTVKRGMHDSQEYEHPAFGMIRAARVSGQTTLHGSDYEHRNWIEVTITHGDLIRNLNQDWYHAGKEIVSVQLSEAQWATFVSSLNVGSGVPCTIDHIQHKLMPGIPLRKPIKEVADIEFETTTKKMAARVNQAIKSVEETMQGIPQKKKESVLGHLRMIKQDLESNFPFIRKQFGEQIETQIEKAKIEVNAYVQDTIMRAGINTLGRNEGPLLLNRGEEDEK